MVSTVCCFISPPRHYVVAKSVLIRVTDKLTFRDTAPSQSSASEQTFLVNLSFQSPWSKDTLVIGVLIPASVSSH
jgi:hypothetical protein